MLSSYYTKNWSCQTFRHAAHIVFFYCKLWSCNCPSLNLHLTLNEFIGQHYLSYFPTSLSLNLESVHRDRHGGWGWKSDDISLHAMRLEEWWNFSSCHLSLYLHSVIQRLGATSSCGNRDLGWTAMSPLIHLTIVKIRN